MNVWSSNSNCIGRSAPVRQDDVHSMGINTKMVYVDNEISKDTLARINFLLSEIVSYTDAIFYNFRTHMLANVITYSFH